MGELCPGTRLGVNHGARRVALNFTRGVSIMGFDSDQSGNSSVVEHRLAKARVAGSNPVSRSIHPARMAD